MTNSPTIPPDDTAPSTPTPVANVTLNNVDRLLKHLEANSLAAQLVEAHRLQSDAPDKSMKGILKARLQQVKETLERPKA